MEQLQSTSGNLWIGIEVPSSYDGKPLVYHRLQEKLKEVIPGYKEDDKLHITLFFFGVAQEEKIKKIDKTITKSLLASKIYGNSITHITFDNKLTLFGTALALKIQENNKLNDLRQLLADKLKEAGIPFAEQHSFNPHVTLGRSTEITQGVVERLNIDINPNKNETNQFDINNFYLYETQGLEYTIRAMYSLKPPVYYLD